MVSLILTSLHLVSFQKLLTSNRPSSAQQALTTHVVVLQSDTAYLKKAYERDSMTCLVRGHGQLLFILLTV